MGSDVGAEWKFTVSSSPEVARMVIDRGRIWPSSLLVHSSWRLPLGEEAMRNAAVSFGALEIGEGQVLKREPWFGEGHVTSWDCDR